MMDARNPTTKPQAQSNQAELTLRGIALGAAITVIFMAANLYMGLKTGMTFSSSIPAAMISMGAFRLMGGAGILENNIVQTQASAAGTLCNVILALPGLVLIGHWHGFPFWQTTAVCPLGRPPRRRLLDPPAPRARRRQRPSLSRRAWPPPRCSGPARGRGRPAACATCSGPPAAAGAIGLATTGLKVLGDGLNGAISLGGAVFRTGTGSRWRSSASATSWASAPAWRFSPAS